MSNELFLSAFVLKFPLLKVRPMAVDFDTIAALVIDEGMFKLISFAWDIVLAVLQIHESQLLAIPEQRLEPS